MPQPWDGLPNGEGGGGTPGPQGSPGTPGADGLNTDAWRVVGLVGINNTVTPNTQYDVSADAVVLYNTSNGTVVVRTATGVITNNILTAGPAANGRDQVGAFSASTWIHIYFIWNGTTLATLSSAVAPPTGPTLPTGYTHWAYCGAVRYNATPVLLPTRFSGCQANLDIVTGGESRVLSTGTATTMTAVSCAAYAPPNSRRVLLTVALAHNTVDGVRYALSIRPTGTSQAGQDVCTIVCFAANVPVVTTWIVCPVNASQSFDYMTTPAGVLGAFIDVIGYLMPNGGE